MIKKIIHTGDIHIRNLRRMDEYQEQLSKFLDECRDITSQYEEGEVRIVIAGDLLHNKLDISGEGYVLASWFLRELDKITKTFVISGNHDINMRNLNRLDPLSAIFSMCKFNQTYYLDSVLNFQSGCLVDDNIVWCLYSSFDNFAKPNIEEVKINHLGEDLTYVGLFHGIVLGAKTDTDYVSESGYHTSYFDGIDMGMLAHIHQRQCLKYNGVPLVYCGSLIQQNHGENVSTHGYLLWDVEEQTYEEKNIANEENGFYTFAINSIDDIDNDIEEIINL